MAFGGFSKNSGPSLPIGNQAPFPTIPSNIQTDSQSRQRSPSLTGGGRLGTPGTSFSTDFNNNRVSEVPQRFQSSTLDGGGNNSNGRGVFSSSEEALRPTSSVSPPGWVNQSNDGSTFQTHQRFSTSELYPGSRNVAPRISAGPVNPQAPKRNRSPPFRNEGRQEDFGVSFNERSTPMPTLSPPGWVSHSKVPIDGSSFQSHQRSSPVEPNLGSRNAATNITARPVNSQVPKRNRSPPFRSEMSTQESTVGFTGRLGTPTDLRHSPPHNGSSVNPQRMSSPTFGGRGVVSYEDLDQPEEIQMSNTIGASIRDPRGNRSPPLQSSSNVYSRDSRAPHNESERSNTMAASFRDPRGNRSPPLQSASNSYSRDSRSPHNGSERFASPPDLGNKWDYVSNKQSQQNSSKFIPDLAESAGARPRSSQVSKRTRSLTHVTDEFLHGTNYDSQDDTERETQAKAKRLARFKVELTEPAESSPDVLRNKQDQAMAERRKVVAEQPMDASGDIILDSEGLESSGALVGVCPDMCPESERKERERKGDLDKFERLEGDRNQTTESLAVKKYNRTAEREVDLIRPLPVLQKTVSYLLDLLDGPYSENFLPLYNFLWDRMRAVRMDLRMQHIFNHDAISMLEQMIRLHIIAMHELCEYTKGEGFSEGFDAHLNIEQMNKTSVELFQMYDDHRKKGTNIPSEREFRGYYALLKLDKHPGYKVEPAELSLDLAKMTPQIRQTPEILFARDVARACRTGNFIAFFRLAQKATYLQACLMHAHFSKLRTQALASLHSGLQNSQGIPIAQVTKWLGMEGEDVERLLEYHGFVIKEFEEPYMVKEGAFLNSDEDFPTKRSQLVLLKKSRTIFEDVSFDQAKLPFKEVKQVGISTKSLKPLQFAKTKSSLDEQMPDLKPYSAKRVSQAQPVYSPPKRASQAQTVFEMPTPINPINPITSNQQWPEVTFSPSIHPSSLFALSPPAMARVTQAETPQVSVEMNPSSFPKVTPLKTMRRAISMERTPVSYVESPGKKSAPLNVVTIPEQNIEVTVIPQKEENEGLIVTDQEEEVAAEEEDDEEEAKLVQQENEAATAKLKLVLRMWRRRSAKQKQAREQRQLEAIAALNSLSFGPPIRQNKSKLRHAGELNIDRLLTERRERHAVSWSRLNVSEVVATILGERNPDAKCLCWKLILCCQTRSAQTNSAASWLRSKLMGIGNENDDELAVSTPDLSIWKKWTVSNSSEDICCLSVLRDLGGDKTDDAVAGSGAVVFLASHGLSWELQKTSLNNLLVSLPSNSRAPLLILSDTYEEQVENSSSTIVNKLGLHYIDKTRISSFSVLYLLESQQADNLDGFFSNDRLVEGLQWLADQAPLQPVLRCVKTHELVMGHVNRSLELLERKDVSLVGPDECISVFNSVLDRAAKEVSCAADMNYARWPCTEIGLLEEYIDEHRAVQLYLPSAGWSTSASIEPIISTIQSCELPVFGDDLSWLNHGSDVGEDIQNQKSELEKCLIMYLVHSSKMMDWQLATMEASIMLQKSAHLELHGSSFRIVPRWADIFRRIFNWRLMNLRSGASSVAYVLANQSVSCSEPCQETSPLKWRSRQTDMYIDSPLSQRAGESGSTYALARPSLDEMVEIGCTPLQHRSNRSTIKAIEPIPMNFDQDDNDTLEAATNYGSKESECTESEFTVRQNTYLSHGNDMVVDVKEIPEVNKLNKLLERCSMLQNRIDEKLSIYF
ncbi:hypothetical protein C5167_035793 [Papaver somniferum]|uniref:SAC3 family protein B-like isoform X1 n=2 Tax=Papaver somniferum TaxID=3469 RepID=UPI000E701902|nr:SAC3 family protein B-like isoform X1 [Papaver somniferum]RZC89797.1 hypothetical protein C5167_035793 [Papaver somniferum]